MFTDSLMAATGANIMLAAAGRTNSAQGLYDIKPLVSIPNYILWACLALLGVGLVVAAFYWWRRRQAHRPAAPSLPTESPAAAARRRLQAAIHLIGDPRLFCITVSDVLRNFLEESYGLPAPERTTEEFLEQMQQSALLSYEQKKMLADFLTECDMVKFARYEPPRAALEKLHSLALRIVEESTPGAGSPIADEHAAAAVGR